MKYSNKVYSNPREEEKHDEHLFLPKNKIKNTKICEYRYAPHNYISVNDGPHVRHWSYKIIIL